MMTARTRRVLMALAATVLTAATAGWVTPAQRATAASFTTITGSGSTWSAPAINQWIADVHQNGLIVNYNANGSSFGRSDFAQGTTDFGASEIPYGVVDGTLSDPTPTSRGWAYMPDLAGGTTFMYNLHIGTQQVTDLRLSGAVIAGIFTNQITMWNDPKIAADNPGLALPATRIIPVVRSDGAGSTAEFTEWMIATEGSYWTAYCAATGWNPCTQTSTYPTVPGSAMIAQQGDSGVAGYVSQAGANGAIGYTEYAYAITAGFPVAKVLNAAGYYTVPTPGHIAVSLLKAQINQDAGNPSVYLTQDLSQVYTDTDPRTYELSSYSYMILPTTTNFGISGDKGYTIGSFGEYALCQGQAGIDPLGYSALPINLVEAGFQQLSKIPGATVPTDDNTIVSTCKGSNPTFDANGTNLLADNDPMPPDCDKQGATMCTAATGGAPGSGGASGGDGSGGSGSASPSASASSAAAGGSGNTSTGTGSTSSGSGSTGTGSTSSTSGAKSGSTGTTGTGTTGSGSTGTGSTGTGSTGTGSTGTGSTGTGSAGSGSAGAASNCDPNTGVCTGSTTSTVNGVAVSGTSAGTGNTGAGQAGVVGVGVPQVPVNAQPVSAASSLGDGVQLALMVLAALMLVGLGVGPALIAQASTRRQQRGGNGPYGRRDWP